MNNMSVFVRVYGERGEGRGRGERECRLDTRELEDVSLLVACFF